MDIFYKMIKVLYYLMSNYLFKNIKITLNKDLIKHYMKNIFIIFSQFLKIPSKQEIKL